MTPVARIALAAILLAACLPPIEPMQPPPAPVGVAAVALPPAPTAPAPLALVDGAGADGPRKRLTLDEARRYMVQLVNRDRATAGLAPVELDEGPPTRGGQAHAEDMATHGYLGHWGTDGSVPEQRYTEAGGADMVLENASCFTDEQPRALD
ncbi:MAG TPA: CAP domain-containing protein, partial [Polyangiaceae bacterium]|nr:CAP domain-containing protein [Polyangiaceae bacterium]